MLLGTDLGLPMAELVVALLYNGLGYSSFVLSPKSFKILYKTILRLCL